MEELESDLDRADRLCDYRRHRSHHRWECCWRIVSLLQQQRNYKRDEVGKGDLLLTCVDRLSGVYASGFFRMSTWIPFSWGVINALVLILSSFALQGGM